MNKKKFDNEFVQLSGVVDARVYTLLADVVDELCRKVGDRYTLWNLIQ